jgi:hypothetical protein
MAMNSDKGNKSLPHTKILVDKPLSWTEVHPYLRELHVVISELDNINLDVLADSAIETLRIVIENDVNIDFSPLTQMPSLETIVLQVNSVEKDVLNVLSDCNYLRNLTIKTKQDGPLDLSRLSNSNITNIVVWGFQTTDVILPETRTVEELTLALFDISEIDLSPLRHCEEMRILRIDFGSSLSKIDLTPLSSCEKLNSLTMSLSGVSDVDLTPLKPLRGLKTIDLSGTQLQNINLHPLTQNTSLEILKLSKNLLTEIDLGPLFQTNLHEIWIDINNLEELDISPLPSTVKKLILRRNSLKSMDLSPLRGSEIESIRLDMNKIETLDLEPLLNCKFLTELNLSANPFSSVVEHIVELETQRNLRITADDIAFPEQYLDDNPRW